MKIQQLSYRPPFITLDVTRKACFKFDEMLLEISDVKYDGEVDLETSWHSKFKSHFKIFSRSQNLKI